MRVATASLGIQLLVRKVCYASPAGLLPGLLGILTNVQEKLALGHVAPPSGPAGGAAFPKATHRKLSKVVHIIQAVQIGMHPCPELRHVAHSCVHCASSGYSS